MTLPVIVNDGKSNLTHCPTCGMVVRLSKAAYTDGYVEYYDAVYDSRDVAQVLQPQDPETAAKLRKARKDKKTVAFVGLAPTSCSLAPFDDLDVEIWCLNESHAFPQWLKRWDRWFQIHADHSWQRIIAKRDVVDHFDWLQKEHPSERESRTYKKTSLFARLRHILHKDEFTHEEKRKEKNLKPIYMQYWHPQVPNSVGYPLREVNQLAFNNFWRGDKKVKYYTSTFCYMMGIAMLEKFERVEIYGFEMADEIEYVQQKAAAEFWIGLALGKGVEVYTPPNCQILWSAMYGGNEQGAGW